MHPSTEEHHRGDDAVHRRDNGDDYGRSELGRLNILPSSVRGQQPLDEPPATNAAQSPRRRGLSKSLPATVLKVGRSVVRGITAHPRSAMPPSPASPLRRSDLDSRRPATSKILDNESPTTPATAKTDHCSQTSVYLPRGNTPLPFAEESWSNLSDVSDLSGPNEAPPLPQFHHHHRWPAAPGLPRSRTNRSPERSAGGCVQLHDRSAAFDQVLADGGSPGGMARRGCIGSAPLPVRQISDRAAIAGAAKNP